MIKFLFFIITVQNLFSNWIQLTTDQDFLIYSIERPKPLNSYGENKKPFYFWNEQKRDLFEILIDLSNSGSLYTLFAYSALSQVESGSTLLGTSTHTNNASNGSSTMVVTSGNLQVRSTGGRNSSSYVTVGYNGSFYSNFDGPHGYELNMLSANIYQLETGRSSVAKGGIYTIFYSWVRITPSSTISIPSDTPVTVQENAALPADLVFTVPPAFLSIPNGALTISRSRVRGGSTVLVEGRVD